VIVPSFIGATVPVTKPPSGALSTSPSLAKRCLLGETNARPLRQTLPAGSSQPARVNCPASHVYAPGSTPAL
jgi:hypothetical protein